MKFATGAVRTTQTETLRALSGGRMILDVIVSLWLFLAVVMGSLVLWESRRRFW